MPREVTISQNLITRMNGRIVCERCKLELKPGDKAISSGHGKKRRNKRYYHTKCHEELYIGG